jgi:hypothetical protein
MSDLDEPLDPALSALLDDERAREGAPTHVRDAVRARVRATIATGGGLPAGRSDPSPSPAPHQAPTPSSPRVGHVLRRLAGVTGLLATGAAAGAVAHARIAAQPRERIVYVDRIVEHRVEVPVPVPMAPSTAAALSSDVDASAAHDASNEHLAASGRHVEVHDEPVSGDLDAERALLDRARSALVRGRGTDALAAIAEHAQRYPRGQLTEEFEGVRVQALVAAHRYDEARAAAIRFHERFGDSLLGPVVDAAIRTIP